MSFSWVSPTAIYDKCGQVGPATDLIDGNTSSFWSHLTNHLHFVTVDLGQTMLVSKIRTYNTNDAGQFQDCDIYVGDDPEDLGDPVASWGYSGTGWRQKDLPETQGRYIKIGNIDTRDAAGTPNQIALFELEVFAEPVTVPEGYAFIM